ncbi:hypothetical protein GGU11DRAFT_123888 [Lentinula aff. detonsa]|nr:hypothetical protein GGU11DRAFT_123888 [Lentinula aff. detonsa]
MALTQTARIPGPGPSWDEQVVPALRKRLESESRTLARRISAVSISSAEAADDYSNPTSPFQYAPTPAPPPVTTISTRKPKQHYQSSSTSSRPGSRSRTHSQPSNVNQVNRTSSSSRPTSPPNQSSKTSQSRIPLPQRTRSRTGSLSSQHHNQNRNKTPTPNDTGSSPAADLWVVHERPSHSRLVNEPAPFPPQNSSVSSLEGLPEPRPSNDSEERPFEHWYRGEVSRNGGVGEYRVAKRQEMLEIANYGHSIRLKKQNNTMTEAIDLQRQRRGRPRSESLGDRTSFYLDEEQAKEAARVMDENPLTDNGEEDDDGEEEYYDPMEDYYRPENIPPRTTTPRPSRIPTPTQLQRGQSEPPYFPSSSAGASTSALNNGSPATPKQRPPVLGTGTGTSQSKPNGATSPPSASNKGKAKASNSTTPSPSSNSRLAASKATQAKLAQNKRQREKEEESRRSIAAYPDPGDDLMNAIPTWTQPVPKAGNWDDVVLPVVARKKGLDGHYQRGNGSPQQRKDEVTIAPAPGTFGFDHSKYRPPRDGEENIPMDEFGARNPTNSEEDNENKIEVEEQPPQPRLETPHDQTRLPTHAPYSNKRTSSPVPFSSYKAHSSQPDPMDQMGQMDTDVEKGRAQRTDVDEDAGKGGCCGCVVM